MIFAQPPTHPDVPYWTCPVGDFQLAASGELFRTLAVIGTTVQTADLAEVLPTSMLVELEDAVERHEGQHLRIGGAS